MTAEGQTRRLRDVRGMSGLPPNSRHLRTRSALRIWATCGHPTPPSLELKITVFFESCRLDVPKSPGDRDSGDAVGGRSNPESQDHYYIWSAYAVDYVHLQWRNK